MGYIFDALNRSGSAGEGPPEGDPKAALPPFEELTNDRTAASHELDAQLDALSEQVEDLAAELKEPLQAPATAMSSAEPPAAAAPREEAAAPAPLPRLVGTSEKLDERLVVLGTPGSLMAEEYRSIRTQLLARCEHKRHLIHTITSATPQEGKTITSLNLGLSFAELRNRSTIVIEADLRLPTFAKLMRLDDGPGMIAYLRGEAELDSIVRGIDGSRLHVIPAGSRCSADAIQLLSSSRMAQLLRDLRERYDHVIIDTPPVTELADAGILGALSDEVMLVVRMQRTPQTLVEQAIRTLRGYHAPVAGVIATDQSRSRRGYYYYRYGYRYHYYTKDAA